MIQKKPHHFHTAMLVAFVMMASSACTERYSVLPPGFIPKIENVSLKEQKYGQRLFDQLREENQTTSDHPKYNQMIAAFDHLKQVAEVDHLPWRIYLFCDPNQINARAVHGNIIFVWSGLLDVAADEDEIAAILAYEMAHVLARHTLPVQYNALSDLFFQATEMAATLAILQLSQGMVMLSGSGWMKWAYTEAADLDPLDRKYSVDDEWVAAEVAFLVGKRSRYCPESILTFWKRIEENKDLRKNAKGLSRRLSPRKRLALLEELLLKLPDQAPPMKPFTSESATGDLSG